jgi:hypothetical protein
VARCMTRALLEHGVALLACIRAEACARLASPTSYSLHLRPFCLGHQGPAPSQAQCLRLASSDHTVPSNERYERGRPLN